jgi:hypothetical protein
VVNGQSLEIHLALPVSSNSTLTSKPMQEAGDRKRCGRWSSGARLPQGGLKGPEEDMEHSGSGPGPVVEEGPKTLGDREHKLSYRDVGEDVVGHMGSGLCHAAGPARGT